MKQNMRRKLTVAAGLLAAFVLWTVAVRCVDVAAIGPLGTSVGLAGLNGFFHDLTGVHMAMYTLTDWLSLIPLVIIFGFGILGLGQWLVRKKLRLVDRSLLALGGFYLTVLTVYFLFEKIAVNYRPVLISGNLEASYPSSTTVLVLCVMPTVVMQLRHRIRNRMCSRCVAAAMTVFALCMVLGRLISGVHWLTDIIGGVLLSAGLVLLYDAIGQP